MPKQKKWIIASEPEQKMIHELSQSININPVLSKILLSRGISNFEEAKTFFRPSIEDCHDPFLMKDMPIAVERLIKALDNHESILVYGDYDVDGSTSVAMMYSFLKSYCKNLYYYIPDRYVEGYGISYKGIDYAKEKNCSLIISLDCGIKAIDKVDYANSENIDFIICDHHNPSEKLPQAVAVLDPKRKDCPYPFKELSGCGVGFKLIQAFCIQKEIPEHHAFELLDLVAISIAADIVAVTGENRILAFYGLEKINFNPRPGIKALIQASGLKEKITISNLVFQLGPRINAAGRIDHAHLAVRLLTAIHEDEALIIAENVSHKNTTRKDFDQNITSEALSTIEENTSMLSAKSTVLFNKNWHKGVIGIVASRCIEHHYRPTIIMTESNGKATGSARSVDGFDLYSAIESCKEYLEQFGGHKHAAGLTLAIDQIPSFAAAFEAVVQKNITEDQLIPKVKIDSYIEIDQITDKFYSILSQMDPFGPGNMQPVFAAKNLSVLGEPLILKEKHLKLTVKDRSGKNKITAIGFGMAEYKALIMNSNAFELAFTIQENHFNGLKSLQLYLKDIRID
ncbi:single-stranded-DNA-specific exonuclease RecJ [Marivirga tractuosa]|uniref:Single-stranded-DNA-specific exonuclease RecJ n=1 Tax=Marivirga tractuosa (strain ATCC 23168 / DSM 4126 / NBRC 15989 / NCIMB 1408 / VKM B-1430 / H-43) TaxID=643867 RepID=E4TMZ9_MARTH|nr:single-stranded-DNA-specific exonuclease RecJ [Marivirga tractuosa]ADR21430.1 exonuclease RecJ [Marivirga tractuosa DSM 4126]BDD14116.1 single-stranded-DNA-specific exonuclease RecJ [Marivirga tractuosa]